MHRCERIKTLSVRVGVYRRIGARPRYLIVKVISGQGLAIELPPRKLDISRRSFDGVGPTTCVTRRIPGSSRRNISGVFENVISTRSVATTAFPRNTVQPELFKCRWAGDVSRPTIVAGISRSAESYRYSFNEIKKKK